MLHSAVPLPDTRLLTPCRISGPQRFSSILGTLMSSILEPLEHGHPIWRFHDEWTAMLPPDGGITVAPRQATSRRRLPRTPWLQASRQPSRQVGSPGASEHKGLGLVQPRSRALSDNPGQLSRAARARPAQSLPSGVQFELSADELLARQLVTHGNLQLLQAHVAATHSLLAAAQGPERPQRGWRLATNLPRVAPQATPPARAESSAHRPHALSLTGRPHRRDGRSIIEES